MELSLVSSAFARDFLKCIVVIRRSLFFFLFFFHCKGPRIIREGKNINERGFEW